MNRPTALIAAIAAVIALTCGVTVGIPAMFAGRAAADPCGVPVPGAPAASGSAPAIAGWSPTATGHAATIVAAGKQVGVPARGWIIAVATAMQESSLRNLASHAVPESLQYPNDGTGADLDSVGLFQQRGNWGSAQERMTPSIAAGKFYAALQRVDGWEQMRVTDAAQAVQHSGYPEAYQQWEDDSQTLIAGLLGLPDLDSIGGGGPAAPCGPDAFGPAIVGPGGWTQPVHAGIVSPFGPRGDRLHAGVDLGSVRHTPIRAASTGIVITSRCDDSTADTVGSCDLDGSPSARGCGWYVDIWHPGNTGTRYCHMVRRPEVAVGATVAAGQVIGYVGTSGNSSGPHLHFQTHTGVAQGQRLSNNNATDPESFMRAAGAPLGA